MAALSGPAACRPDQRGPAGLAKSPARQEEPAAGRPEAGAGGGPAAGGGGGPKMDDAAGRLDRVEPGPRRGPARRSLRPLLQRPVRRTARRPDRVAERTPPQLVARSPIPAHAFPHRIPAFLLRSQPLPFWPTLGAGPEDRLGGR